MFVPERHQGIILVADDNESNRELLSSLLGQEGYQTIPVTDGQQALEQLSGLSIDLALLDVVMPERNGFQVCRDLKGNADFNMIPVIMVTSKDSASDKFWGQQQGADGYVTKPFTREDLLRAVRRFA